MTQLQRQVRVAQRILTLNRWQGAAGWCFTIAAIIFAATVLVQRLFDFSLPLLYAGIGLALSAAIGSILWAYVRRVDSATAAAMLDEQAGLRERISSGLHCLDSDDPFAQAVVADAERLSAAVTVGKHVRLTLARPLAFTFGSFLLASSMFLVSPGLLKSPEDVQAAETNAETEQLKIAVKREMEQVRKMAEENPVLAELTPQLEDQADAGARLQRPEAMRHEALKKLDNLEDSVKQKRSDEKYRAVPDLKKMLRALQIPESQDAPTEKLTNALAKGDFQEAKEEVSKLQEQLATLKADQDKELVDKMSRQLEDLAKQIEKVAGDDKLAQKLEQAGIKKEDIERMLERLSKADIEQVKKQLEEKGLNQKQIESIAKQLQQKQQSGTRAKQMAEGMKKAAKGAQSGQMGEAMAGMQQTGEQLGELEKLEQEMNQLESAMADLQNARNNLDKPCSQCQGSGKGCSKCGGKGNRQGGGMGDLGRGRGGLAPEERTAVDFKIERQKVHTGKGATIGEFLIDGEQLKGQSSASLTEVVTAAEREASDLIHRDRVPRQYHKAIKEYFSTLKESEKSPKRVDSADAENETGRGELKRGDESGDSGGPNQP